MAANMPMNYDPVLQGGQPARARHGKSQSQRCWACPGGRTGQDESGKANWVPDTHSWAWTGPQPSGMHQRWGYRTLPSWGPLHYWGIFQLWEAMVTVPGRALLAGGDIQFAVSAVVIEEAEMLLLPFPTCDCAVSTSSSSYCYRRVAIFSDPCCKLALKCHDIPGALFISHWSKINKPDTSSYFERRWNAVNKCHPWC